MSLLQDRSIVGVIGLLFILIGVLGVAHNGVVGLGSSRPRAIPSTLEAERDRSASRAISMVEGCRRIRPELGEAVELGDGRGEKEDEVDDNGESCEEELLYRNSASRRLSRSTTVTPGGRLN